MATQPGTSGEGKTRWAAQECLPLPPSPSAGLSAALSAEQAKARMLKA